MIKSIRKWGDPVLKEPCSPLEATDDRKFINILVETLLATKDGVGIAAPQIGVSKRVLAYRQSPSSEEVVVMINPIIVETGKVVGTAEEGCLSYPGIFTRISRPTTVKVSWKEPSGYDRTKEFRGIEAVIVQHEMDHLEGICLVGNAWEATREDTLKFNEEAINTQ